MGVRSLKHNNDALGRSLLKLDGELQTIANTDFEGVSVLAFRLRLEKFYKLMNVWIRVSRSEG